MGWAPSYTVAPDPDALARRAAELILDSAIAAVGQRGRFTIALAGGATPRATYRQLAHPPLSERLPWARTWVFFGDERMVAPDHPESNYHSAREALLAHVPIPDGQVIRVRGEHADPEAAAAEYADRLAQVLAPAPGTLPRFDVVLLGLGVDGHTASLFPGAAVLKEGSRTVAPVHVAAAAIPRRVTLTLPVVNAAARVIFLVAGREKARAVKAVLGDAAPLPATMVRPIEGELLWLLDRAAAALLPGVDA